jgi:transcriptional regulator
MHEILKLRLQGLSAYKIARKLEVEPPTVYAALKAAKQNFPEAEKMINELRALGWPSKLVEVERAQQRRIAAHTQPLETPTRSEEIPIKLG